MLNRIDDIKKVNELVTSSLKIGVITNCTLTPNQWHEEIENKTLFYYQFDGGVFFFRLRDYGYKLNYYIYNFDNIPKIQLDKPSYVEIVLRPKDNTQIVNSFENLGFKQLFTRIRMKNTIYEQKNLPKPEYIEPKKAYDFLNSVFDKKTACLPTIDELEQAEKQGLLLWRKNNENEITALLHVKQDRKKYEIRHLAVSENERKKGLALSLANEFISRFGHCQTLVWVREDYSAPKHIYEKTGFKPDGFKAIVMSN